jgi:uncharacterized protein (TIGR03437 family)
MNSAGLITGTPSPLNSPGFAGSVTVTDSSTPPCIVTGIPLSFQVFRQLTVTTSALPVGSQGVPYSQPIQAAGGVPPYSWSLGSSLTGTGLGLNAATGVLSGTPAAAGLISFTVQVTDSAGSNVSQTIALNVYGPLSITTPQLPNGLPLQPYGPVTMAGAGGSGNFSWSSTGLPSGLAISKAGVISGSAGVNGTFPVNIFLSDVTTGLVVLQSYSLTIGSSALSITTPAPIEVAPGGSVSVTLAATGGVAPYTFSAVGTPPQGFALTPGGLLTGTPSQPGTIGIAVQVTDSETPPLTVSATINVGVLGLSNTSPLPAGTTTATYSATFKAVGGVAPYTFTASGLPAGLSLSSSGVLTGIVAKTGTYSFTVQVTDSTAITSSSTYSLTINLPGPLTLATPSLPNGTTNVAYSASLSASASGGNPPYAWAIEAGTLPTGLSLSSTGIISGTPTSFNTSSFTVQATDGSGATASISATLQINPAGLAITTQSPLSSGIVNVDYPQQVLTAAGGVPPYTFSITGGSLPNGLSLSNGVITGTPTTAGGFTITATVQDSAGTQGQTTLTGAIRPPSTDLVLSTGTLSFAISTGASTLPPFQNVSVTSSDVTQAIPFTIQASPGSSWLTISSGSASGGSITPTALIVSLTSQALGLASSQTPYTAIITVTCNASTPCAGNTQTLSVALTVAAAPALLNPVTNLLSFSTTSSPPAASTQQLTIQNTGGDPLSFDSIGCEASWCTVGSVPMFVYGGASLPINVTADPTGLTPGFYRTTVDISTSAGFASIPVTLLIAESSELLLAPSGLQISMLAGGSPGNPNGSFLVSVADSSTVSWTAAVTSKGTGWLTLNSTSGTASGSAPGAVSFSIDPTMTAGLAAQPYYATITVTAPGAINSPQNFEVVLNVAPAATPLFPDPQPTGLVFLAEAGSTPPPQTVQVFASSATMPTGYQASATTNDGAPWLSVSPLTGTTSTSPGQSEVTVNPSSLSPGIYYGLVNYSFSPAAVRTVSVTLIVEAAIAGPDLRGPSPNSVHSNAAAPPACTPSALAPAQTGLVNNFSTPASWPTPLSILLLDDCGHAVPKGQIVVTFTNGDPPLALGVANSSTGLYSGTWTPRKTSSQISLNARATAAGFAAASLQIAGQVVPNTAPVINQGSILNAFNPQLGSALAPGTIVQIYGSGLASATVPSPVVPLPTILNGTQIIIGGIPAPLFYVSPGQINAQIPFELNPNNQYQLIVSANGALTAPVPIQLSPVTPGFLVNPDGSLIAQHPDGTLITPASPAQPGENVTTYLAGMGNTTTTVSDGDVSPTDPPAATAVPPILLLNGMPSPLLFAGLTPTLVGLYQIDFQIPPDTANGDLMVAISQDLFVSNSAIMPVQGVSSSARLPARQ